MIKVLAGFRPVSEKDLPHASAVGRSIHQPLLNCFSLYYNKLVYNLNTVSY
jgi:hypothetical protein